MVEIILGLKWPLIILQAIVAPILVLLVLLQSSKGDDLGAALSGGGGGSGSVLGTGGASKLLVKLTVIFATVFLLNSVFLAKIFKESSIASVGGSQAEPLAPANALGTNALTPVPESQPVTPAK